MNYDSKKDTQAHIDNVRAFLVDIIARLEGRIKYHDQTKFQSPEKEIFDEMTPLLAGSIYGSDEYKRMLAEMQPALDHHYKNNRHHPEHFKEGINGMTIIDFIEMLCDWKAATMRHDNGDINRSLEINKSRFEINDQLVAICKNTVKYLNW